MAKNLTAASIEALKPDPRKRREVPDALAPGLYLIIQPSGAKSWAIRFRDPKTRRPCKMTLTGIGPTDLVRARDVARDQLKMLAGGVNPATAREKAREAEADAASDTFESQWAIFAEQKIAKMRPGSSYIFRRHARFFSPLWLGRPIREIRKRDVVKVIDLAGEQGDHAANSCRMVLFRFFKWCLSRDAVAVNPVLGIERIEVDDRERVLEDHELRAIWKAADKLGGPFGALCKVLMLTGQRRGETSRMKWADIKGDVWTIPAAETKTAKAHEVYLCPLALKIINNLPRFDGCPFVFTSAGKTPSANFSKAKTQLDALAGISDWRWHDLRRSFATGLAAMQVEPIVIEKCLNHALGGVAAIYNRHPYTNEKRKAWESWGRHIGALIGGKRERSNVVTMIRPA